MHFQVNFPFFHIHNEMRMFFVVALLRSLSLSLFICHFQHWLYYIIFGKKFCQIRTHRLRCFGSVHVFRHQCTRKEKCVIIGFALWLCAFHSIIYLKMVKFSHQRCQSIRYQFVSIQPWSDALIQVNVRIKNTYASFIHSFIMCVCAIEISSDFEPCNTLLTLKIMSTGRLSIKIPFFNRIFFKWFKILNKPEFENNIIYFYDFWIIFENQNEFVWKAFLWK